MALIECLECKKQISSEATSCPHCGFPIQKTLTSSNQSNVIANAQPSQPTLLSPGFEPQLGRIILGIILSALCGWLALSWIPEHSPYLAEEMLLKYPGKIIKDLSSYDPTEVIRIFKGKLPSGCPEWWFSKNEYPWILGIAYLFFVGGIFELLYGAFYKDYRILFCQKCNSQIIARKKIFGLKCEKCNSTLQRNYLSYVMLTLTLAILFVCLFMIIRQIY